MKIRILASNIMELSRWTEWSGANFVQWYAIGRDLSLYGSGIGDTDSEPVFRTKS